VEEGGGVELSDPPPLSNPNLLTKRITPDHIQERPNKESSYYFFFFFFFFSNE
jgi:hypothetical protein